MLRVSALKRKTAKSIFPDSLKPEPLKTGARAFVRLLFHLRACSIPENARARSNVLQPRETLTLPKFFTPVGALWLALARPHSHSPRQVVDRSCFASWLSKSFVFSSLGANRRALLWKQSAEKIRLRMITQSAGLAYPIAL